MENEFENENRRRGTSINKSNNENKNDKVKKRKLNILDILVILTLVILLCIYVPRAYKLFRETKKDDASEKVITYPLEVKITETDATLFSEMMKDYAVGVLSDVDPSDGFDDTEKVNFVRHILSEKYKSSGVVAKTAMNNMLKKYFDIEDLDYTSLGFKKLSVYKEYEIQYVYNITKLEQYDEQGEIYLAYADKVNKENVTDSEYEESSVEGEYVFTLKKIVEITNDTTADTTNETTTTSTAANTTTKSTTDANKKTEYRYIIEKVEEKIEEPTNETTEVNK